MQNGSLEVILSVFYIYGLNPRKVHVQSALESNLMSQWYRVEEQNSFNEYRVF